MNTPISSMRTLMTSTVLAFALGAMGCATGAPSAASAHSLAGAEAPVVELTTSTGASSDFVEPAPGKVTIVAFAAGDSAWNDRMVELGGDLAGTFPDHVEVVAVTTSPTSRMREHAAVRIARDPHGAVARAYGAPEGLSVYLVDARGTVRHVHAGFDGSIENEIVDEVAALVSESAAADPGRTRMARRSE